MKTRYEKFSTLNSYVKITKDVSIAVGVIGLITCIPLLIFGYLVFVGLWDYLAFGDLEELILALPPCLTSLGISFSLFYTAGLLLIISELIQCFLAIEENTYQSAKNTSSNPIPSANQPTD